MTLPTSIGSASHFDQGTDDPKQARAQLKQIRDDLETINNHLKASAFLAPSTPLGIGHGLESSGGNLRAKLQTNPGLARSADGLALDINGLTAETAPAVADVVALYDASAAALRKMTLQNLLKVINALTEDSTPDTTADFVAAYDASAGTAKKVKLANLAGTWQKLDSQTPSAQSTVDFETSFTNSTFVAHRLVFDELRGSIDSQLPIVRVKAGGAYKSGASDYAWSGKYRRVDTGVEVTGRSSTDSSISLSAGDGLGNAANERGRGWIEIQKPTLTGFGFVTCNLLYFDQQGFPYEAHTAGQFLTVGAIEGLQVLFASGTLSGNFLQVGLSNA